MLKALKLYPVGAAVGATADEAVIHQAPPHKDIILGNLCKEGVQFLFRVSDTLSKGLHDLSGKCDPLPGF
ncbi:MAG: hypothetical protein WC116_08730, partial [Thermovirgaceae bacterium]